MATVNDVNFQGGTSGQLEITGMIYSLWKTQEFSAARILAGDAEPEADADLDGLANLAEYGLGTDPNAFTPPPAFTLDASFLTLIFEHPKDRNDVTCLAESCGALGVWENVPLEATGGTATHETLRARVPRPVEGDRLFLRLRFEP